MKDKKGFTLIELLAVIVILSVILAIAGTAVIKSINDSKEKTRFLAASDIVEIASAYMLTSEGKKNVITMHTSTSPSKETSCISVEKMITDGYIEEDVTNPVNGENRSSSNKLTNQYVCKIDSTKQTDYALKTGDDDYNGYDSYSFEEYKYLIPQGSASAGESNKTGDVDNDGELTEADAEMILNYDAGKIELTDEQEKNADVNGDGTVNAQDAIQILKIVSNNQDYLTGDVNGDGKVTEEDAELVLKYDAKTGTLTDTQKKRADVTGDGKVDAADAVQILKIAADNQDYLKGDVNGDGKVTEEDSNLVLRYDAGLTTLTSAQKKRADVTGDGKINASDSVIILRIAAGLYDENNNILYGDVNGDGKITKDDAELVLRHDAGLTTLAGDKYKRANVNNDNKVDAQDAVIILQMIEKQGDVNGDGKIDDTDARLVLEYDAGLTTLTTAQKSVADMNGDGKLNAQDAVMILQKANS